MGYSTFAYGMDVERLASAKGSGNQELLSQIERDFAAELATISRDFRDSPIMAEAALREIVSGQVTHSREDAAAIYLYVVELMCRAFGRMLDGSESIRYLEDLEWEIEERKLNAWLGLPSPLGFPDVSYWTPEQVRAEYDRLADEDTDHDENEITQAREEFVGWLQQCAEAGTGLVTFCY
jgi:hypothetical protein